MFKLPCNVKKIFDFLQDFETYLVGGSVRDLLLGIPLEDYDFATAATPQEMLHIFKKYKLKTIEVGKKFGTIGIVFQDCVFEITTFREDCLYQDFRKPKSINFVSSFLQDSQRRDFTINALAYHPKKGLLDYHQGREDLSNKILRAIGEPKERFLEDALRILRGIGFVARFDLKVEKNTKEAMLNHANLLEFISKERITNEYKKILQGKFLHRAFVEFKEIFLQIFKTPLCYCEALSKVKDFCLQSAIFLQDEKALESLSLSTQEQKKIKTFMQWQKKDYFKDKVAIKKMLASYQKEWIEIFLSQDKKKLCLLEEILQNDEIYHLRQLHLKGNDLLAFDGKQRAKILQDILYLVIEEKLPNDREKLLAYIKKLQ